MYKQQLIWNTYCNHWNTFTWALLLFHTAHSHGQTKEKEMKFKSAHYFLLYLSKKKYSKLEPLVVLNTSHLPQLESKIKGYLISSYHTKFTVTQGSINPSSQVLISFSLCMPPKLHICSGHLKGLGCYCFLLFLKICGGASSSLGKYKMFDWAKVILLPVRFMEWTIRGLAGKNMNSSVFMGWTPVFQACNPCKMSTWAVTQAGHVQE